MYYAILEERKCSDGNLIKRTSVPAADAILGQAYRVLDKGFIRLIDYMGDDARIVQAARTSYGDGTKTVSEDDGLIRYLIENQHTSPLEQVNFTFHVKLPIFVARQIVRHRTASLNEISGRYSIMKDEFYVPNISDIAAQSTNNKQGRDEAGKVGISDSVKSAFRIAVASISEFLFERYHSFIDSNIARELSRIILPLNTYTEWYWTIDLNNLIKFLYLRMDEHAQWEVREYANVKCELARLVAPKTVRAYEELIFRGARLIEDEKDLFKKLLLEKIASGETIDLEEKRMKKLMGKLGIDVLDCKPSVANTQ